MSNWKEYQKTAKTEMRPYISGEDLSKVTVSSEVNPEEDMGWIARDGEDMWYIPSQFHNDNYEEVEKEDSTFMDRLLKEKEELGNKINDLSGFLNSPASNTSNPTKHTSKSNGDV